MVTTCSAHIRFGKWHFLKREHLTSKLWFLWLQHVLQILYTENATFWGDSYYYSYSLNPFVMVTMCMEHTRSRKCNFLRRGHLTSELIFLLLQHAVQILGLENATVWGNSYYYSSNQLDWLLHLLKILGKENASFWGEDIWLANLYSHGYKMNCTY